MFSEFSEFWYGNFQNAAIWKVANRELGCKYRMCTKMAQDRVL